jgi:hypothetical protein
MQVIQVSVPNEELFVVGRKQRNTAIVKNILGVNGHK